MKVYKNITKIYSKIELLDDCGGVVLNKNAKRRKKI